jgi:hypothetical protein
MAESCPKEPDPIKRKGFQFGRSGLTVGGIQRASGEKLRELMLPETVKGVRARKRAEEEAKAVGRKPWFAAQLRHYGLETTSKDTVDQLKARLKASIKENKVDIDYFMSVCKAT